MTATLQALNAGVDRQYRLSTINALVILIGLVYDARSKYMSTARYRPLASAMDSGR